MISHIRAQALFAFLTAIAICTVTFGSAHAQVRVAVIGDSNVYGKGLSPSQDFPTQLEAALRARGLNASVSNGGINGVTTGGLAARLDWPCQPVRRSLSSGLESTMCFDRGGAARRCMQM